MKVLYFHQHFSTPKGAAGIRSYEMARHLLLKGHSVTIVCGSYEVGQTGLVEPFIDGRRWGVVDGIRIIEFDLSYSNNDGFSKRTLTFLKFAIKSVGLIFTESYDVVFATTTPLTAGIPGIFARWVRGKAFVFEVRDLWPELPKAMGVIRNPFVLRAMFILEYISYHSAHRVIGLSSGIVEGIVNRGVPRDRVTLVPNGCDMDLFTVAPVPWRPAAVKRDDLMAVFAGTHGVANGLDAVLDAAVELKKRNANEIKIVLIGQGKCKSDLQNRAVAQGLDNIVFHEPVSKERLAGLFASTDVGLQILANIPAFYYGTSPNKFFDYIAAGLPVLTNYPGWVAEMIESNQCGFVTRPADPSSFATALQWAAQNKDKLPGMGERSRLLALSQFHRSILAERWIECLECATH